MIFRTLLFLVVMYFLVKLISRLFLPSNQKKQSGRGPGIFYQTFKQYSQQQQNRKTKNSGNKSRHFEEIEEAEFEEITDDQETSSKSSD